MTSPRQSTPYKPGPSRGRPVYGLCVHMPGRTIVEKAVNFGREPLEYVVDYYHKPSATGWPTYVIGYTGAIVQLADERHVTSHVGMVKDGVNDYAALKSGAWRHDVSAFTALEWDAVWSRWHKKNPADLFPGSSPNRVYVGVEVLPRLSPLAHGFWYTPEQHDAVGALFNDLAKRHGFRFEYGRLVGHEDVNPIRRSDAGGGWDPGALRVNPRFDWNRVMDVVGGER